MDYSPDAETTQAFFATVQNKLHFAIHGRTAADLIVARADSKNERMGLTIWKNVPQGKIIKPDVVVAKNYLTEKELKAWDRIVTMYLDYAEDQAERKIPMTMQDWAGKLNAFLKFNERDILNHPGKVSQAHSRRPRIPKGFRRKAQGREERATLGKSSGEDHNPNGVAAVVNVAGPQPRRGWIPGRGVPKVARASQPWAEGRNPFGIERRCWTVPQPWR